MRIIRQNLNTNNRHAQIIEGAINISYKNFTTTEEAQLWAQQNQSDIFYLSSNSPEYKTIYLYTGGGSTIINRFLRSPKSYTKEDLTEDEHFTIETLMKITQGNKTNENITAYRYCDLRYIKACAASRKLKKYMICKDSGFCSTTLVRDKLIPLSKEHNYNCIIKFYLQQGVNGAYISIPSLDTCLDECEFLLSPGTQFKILKIQYKWWQVWSRIKYEVECQVLRLSHNT